MTHCQNGYRTVAVARVSGAEKRMGRRPPRSAKEPPSAGYGRVACSCQSMRQVVCFVVVQVGPFRYCAVELSVSAWSGIRADSGYVLHALRSEWGCLLR